MGWCIVVSGVSERDVRIGEGNVGRFDVRI